MKFDATPMRNGVSPPNHFKTGSKSEFATHRPAMVFASLGLRGNESAEPSMDFYLRVHVSVRQIAPQATHPVTSSRLPFSVIRAL